MAVGHGSAMALPRHGGIAMAMPWQCIGFALAMLALATGFDECLQSYAQLLREKFPQPPPSCVDAAYACRCIVVRTMRCENLRITCARVGLCSAVTT